MKKSLSIILTICLMLSMSFGAFNLKTNAAANTCGKDTSYYFNQLREYINKYGTVNSSGYKTVTVDFKIESLEHYLYFINNSSSTIRVLLHTEMGDAANTCRTEFVLTASPLYLETKNSVRIWKMSGYNVISDLATNTISIKTAEFTENKTYKLSNGGENGFLTATDATNLFNPHIQLLCAKANMFIYEELGFGLMGLGFTSYLDDGTQTHSYGNFISTDADKHWKECACGNKIEFDNHQYDNENDTTCDVCGHVRSLTHQCTFEWTSNGINHWRECDCGAKTDEGLCSGGNATCENKAICSTCGKEYGSFAKCNYIAKVEAQYLVSDATCVAKAVYKKSCSVCGVPHATEIFEIGTVDTNNHAGETEIKNAIQATCTVTGYTGDTWCKECNTKILDGEDILASHKTTEVPAKEATHDKDGNIKYYICSGCDLLFADAEATASTTLENVTIAKGTHNYGTIYKYDNENHWKECDCGDKTEKGVHTFGNWVVTKEATTSQKGSKERTCTVCEYKETRTIPALYRPSSSHSTTKPNTTTGGDSNVVIALNILAVASMLVLEKIVHRRKRAK